MAKRSNKKLKRLLKLTAGWVFILLGILGLFLPFLQGILFLLIGLFILAQELPWAARLLEKLKRKFPKITQQIVMAEDYVKKFLHTLMTNPRALKNQMVASIGALIIFALLIYGAILLWGYVRREFF